MLEKSVKAVLIMENGRVFNGKSFGYVTEAVGEVIFTTANPGYQEVITDPVNTGKIVVMTTPQVGNYGINFEDMESDGAKVSGFIVREKCAMPNNWRCEMELEGFLKQMKIVAIEGIDTRSLTIMLRNEGSMKGIITTQELSSAQVSEKFAGFCNMNAVDSCTCKAKYEIPGKAMHIAALDLGVKKSALESLKETGYRYTVFPAGTKAAEILECGADGIFVTDGPGLPEYIPEVVETIRGLLQKPIHAVGLGQLCLGIAMGGTVKNMKLGHHTASPIKCLRTGKILLPAQNHDCCIDTVPSEVLITHKNINDGTIEGIRHTKINAAGTQFYPKASELRSILAFKTDSATA